MFIDSYHIYPIQQENSLMVKKIKTYIEGFDDKLGGGIPEGHVVLICGTPGTMKTSLTFGLMYQNSKLEGKRGLYISLEEGYDGLKGCEQGFV